MTGAAAPSCPRCGAVPDGACPAVGDATLCARCLSGIFAEPPTAAECEPGDAGLRLAELAGAEEPPPSLPGYEILGRIAAGGVGIVYRARQKDLDRQVAVKVLRADAAADAEWVERFLREARSAARLQHPHIVPIHEASRVGGRLFYSMDFIEGQRLDRWARRPGRGPDEIAALLAKVARAVQYAHERGVIHRDLKPGNILLDAAGEPRVTDFGIAKDASSGGGVTKEGMTVGTPSYMSPEQAAGENGEVGPRSDVYSLGAVLYECLTGKLPFEGPTAAEILRKVLAAEPVPPRRIAPSLPRGLEAICLRALEKDPARRHASAREFAEALDGFRSLRTGPSRRLVVSLAAAGLAVLAVLAVAVSKRDPAAPRSTAAHLAERLLAGPLEEKKRAVDLLAGLDPKEVVPELRPLLAADDPEVRWRAVTVLRELDAKETAPSLIPLLSDPDSDVRRSAADALKELAGPDELPDLVRLLEDRDAGLRRRAGRLLEDLDARAALPDLVRLLGADRTGTRASALETLGRLGATDAAEDILRCLDDEETDVRVEAAAALARLGLKEHAPRILELMRDQDAPVRAAAARALGDLGVEDAIPALLRAESDRSTDPRESAGKALDALGVPAALRKRAAGDPLKALDAGALRLPELNALRRPSAWARLQAPLARPIEGRAPELWAAVGAAASLAVEAPPTDAPARRRVESGTLLEALEGGPAGLAFVLEADRLRILPAAEARAVFRRWWEAADPAPK